MFANKSILLLSMSILTSCATTTREKILRNIIVAGSAGYLIGIQREENKNAYGLLYASSAAAGAALITTYLYDDDSEAERLVNENKKLKQELEKVYSPSLVYQGSGTMNGKVPEKYKNLVNSGELKIFAMDEWIEDGENRLIHQDKMMELIPPSLVPVTVPTFKKE